MTSAAEPERLQKLLAAAGHGSRRQIETLIRAGRITIDGQVATLGARASAACDIRLDGRRLPLGTCTGVAREVLLYHKPLGEVTTRADPQGRPTVFERLPAPDQGRWVVIGRLDVNTTGLLLFTNDGALAHRLMHPSGEIEREYLVRVRGRPDPEALQRLREGIDLDDGRARFERLTPAGGGSTGERDAASASDAQIGADADTDSGAGSHSWFTVILKEGRYREVRRLWQAAGFEVSRLTRVRYGSIGLPRDLRPGQSRKLSAAQAAAL